MRILINAASANRGGAVIYLRNLLKWFPEVASQHQFIVYVPGETLEKLMSLGGNGVLLRSYPFADTAGMRRLYFDQVKIPQLVRKYEVDLLFSTTGFGTLLSPCPQVLLIRNSQYFSEDLQRKYEDLNRSLRTLFLRRWWSLLSIRTSDMVLFPTAAMRDMVEAYKPLNDKHVETIHYGFDRETFLQNREDRSDILEELVELRQQGHHLLLNVSSYALHKNFETLIEALSLLREARFKFKFITTLYQHPTIQNDFDAFCKRIQELGLNDSIMMLGYLPYSSLASIYEQADVFVFPSFTESFGHPLVEAMATGLPIVAANTTVSREVCDGAALYFDTFDAKDCAKQLISVLQHDDLRRTLAQAGQRRSEDFSWGEYTRKLTDLWEDIIAEK